MNREFIEQLYRNNQQASAAFPDKESAEDFIDKLFGLLFLPHVGRRWETDDIANELISLKSYLATLVYSVVINEEIARKVSHDFFERLPRVYTTLMEDAAAISTYDPAAASQQEVVVAYPGFYAIAVYRLAHELHLLDVKTLPRLFTEYAHRLTGIDIHPGAVIGERFFIDHGTGIVIGETALIGNRVKIYQGVTIGALFGTGSQHQRHPTIEDDVIIYAGATILGGKTVIGRGTTVGGNVWLTESVPADSFVYLRHEVGPVTVEASSARQLMSA